jgi:type IV fimbrial biogenesis protein FimT
MSIIETIITMAIVAILIALIVPSLVTWPLNARIRTAAEEALAGLQLARAEAVRRNTNVEFVLDTGAGWTVQIPGTTVEVVQTRTASDMTVGVTMFGLTATAGTATTATFNGMGRLTANAGFTLADSLRRIDIDLLPTVLAAADTRELRLDVSLNGQVRMCDPSVVNTTDSRYCLP